MTKKIVRLTDVIDDDTVGAAREELYAYSRLFPGCDLVLDINSPGGGVMAGLELYGVLRELSDEGHTVVTRIGGQAASMGGVIAQAGDIRQIRKNSYLHLHEVSSGYIGKGSGIKDEAEHAERLTRDLAGIYAERGVKSVDEIYEKMSRREWWLSAQEALDEGFVDVIV